MHLAKIGHILADNYKDDLKNRINHFLAVMVYNV